MGISLSAACGLRAFLPLFVLSVSALFGWVELNQAFDWLGSPVAATAFGCAVLLEIISDKFPVVDNILDAIGSYVKPIAATLIVAGVIRDWDPLLAAIVGLVAGGGTAAAVHIGKAGLRMASTAVTAGLGNVFLSVVEDIAALAGSALAVFAPVLAAALLVFAFVLAWKAIARFRGGKRGEERGGVAAKGGA
jgi:hypothetical protein